MLDHANRSYKKEQLSSKLKSEITQIISSKNFRYTSLISTLLLFIFNAALLYAAKIDARIDAEPITFLIPVSILLVIFALLNHMYYCYAQPVKIPYHTQRCEEIKRLIIENKEKKIRNAENITHSKDLIIDAKKNTEKLLDQIDTLHSKLGKMLSVLLKTQDHENIEAVNKICSRVIEQVFEIIEDIAITEPQTLEQSVTIYDYNKERLSSMAENYEKATIFAQNLINTNKKHLLKTLLFQYKLCSKRTKKVTLKQKREPKVIIDNIISILSNIKSESQIQTDNKINNTIENVIDSCSNLHSNLWRKEEQCQGELNQIQINRTLITVEASVKRFYAKINETKDFAIKLKKLSNLVNICSNVLTFCVNAPEDCEKVVNQLSKETTKRTIERALSTGSISTRSRVSSLVGSALSSRRGSISDLHNHGKNFPSCTDTLHHKQDTLHITNYATLDGVTSGLKTLPIQPHPIKSSATPTDSAQSTAKNKSLMAKIVRSLKKEPTSTTNPKNSTITPKNSTTNQEKQKIDSVPIKPETAPADQRYAKHNIVTVTYNPRNLNDPQISIIKNSNKTDSPALQSFAQKNSFNESEALTLYANLEKIYNIFKNITKNPVTLTLGIALLGKTATPTQKGTKSENEMISHTRCFLANSSKSSYDKKINFLAKLHQLRTEKNIDLEKLSNKNNLKDAINYNDRALEIVKSLKGNKEETRKIIKKLKTRTDRLKKRNNYINNPKSAPENKEYISILTLTSGFIYHLAKEQSNANNGTNLLPLIHAISSCSKEIIFLSQVEKIVKNCVKIEKVSKVEEFYKIEEQKKVVIQTGPTLSLPQKEIENLKRKNESSTKQHRYAPSSLLIEASKECALHQYNVETQV